MTILTLIIIIMITLKFIIMLIIMIATDAVVCNGENEKLEV